MSDCTHGIDRETWVIARAALGEPTDVRPTFNWERAFECALHERCAVLVWLRSGPFLRRVAPPAVVARWRAYAFAAAQCARERATQLGILGRTLAEVGVLPVILKGIPLAATLYADASARPVSDTDIFVSAAQRGIAERALLGDGWVHLYGGPTSEGMFRRDEPDGPHFLEVHSSVLDENLLAHLVAPPPEGHFLVVEDTRVFAQRGPLLTVFLAAHLAKHARVPLLWWIDFATHCSQLRSGELDAVRMLAAQCRLDRILRWAEDGAGELRMIAGDERTSRDAFAALQLRHASEPATRLAELSTSVSDRLQIRLARAIPRRYRRHPLRLARRAAERGWGWAAQWGR